MIKGLEFADGTYLTGVGGFDAPYRDYIYSAHCMVLYGYLQNNQIHVSYNFFDTKKTDKDGNVWELMFTPYNNKPSVRLIIVDKNGTTKINWLISLDIINYVISYLVCYYTRNGELYITITTTSQTVFNNISDSSYFTDKTAFENRVKKYPGKAASYYTYTDMLYYTGDYPTWPNYMFPTSPSSNFTKLMTLTQSEMDESIIPPEDVDPFNPGGNTKPGGGGGTFTITSDKINVPTLPTISAVDSGFLRIFAPTVAELKSLANYMWSDLFDIATYKKIFADPADCILGLSMVPVAVPATTTGAVHVGNISTGVSMHVASSQFVTVDCGNLSIAEYSGSYLDYAPYTKISIYLPYIGTHDLDTDDIMGKTINVKYHVDIVTGACIAFITAGDSVLYQFTGSCNVMVPTSGENWRSAIMGMVSIAVGLGGTIATGGLTAPGNTIMSTAETVTSSKPNVQKSGSLSGSGGFLGIQKPYLIMQIPHQALPAYQNTYIGYPAFITKKLSSLKGFTKIEEIHIENVDASGAELDEIENLLKGGVIL